MKRYAIYYAPPEDAFANAAASWLGRDALTGAVVQQPDFGVPGFSDLTAEPRRYGFHGTLKPPFRLAPGTHADALGKALCAHAATVSAATAGRLSVRRIGRFLALVPEDPLAAIGVLAAGIVDRFERFRAPLTEAETARRRPERLTVRQRALLDRYGYPYVMDEFRFHLTLTGPLDENACAIEYAAYSWFAAHTTAPFRIADICLFGEDEDGRFHLVSRHALTG